MRGPERYVEWINAHLGFHPRGASNSDALSQYVLDDLRYRSPKALDVLINSGDLMPVKNADVAVGEAGLTIRNIDLILREKDSLTQT